LFPQQFIDDLKHHADIVVVIGDYVSLKKSGATYKGLCPFHGEKTPSFHVNRDKGFFHCFGCGLGGDVFKFLELHDKVGFADAVKQLAQRFGMTLPELEQSDEQRASRGGAGDAAQDPRVGRRLVPPAAGDAGRVARSGARGGPRGHLRHQRKAQPGVCAPWP
jgi:DNA primase